MLFVTGLITLLTILNIIVYYLQLNQEEKEDHGDTENSFSLPSDQLCRQFSLAEIKLATHDFNEASIIGKGGFGKVYKGIIDSGAGTVAIKRLNHCSSQGSREFWTEIGMLSKFRHSHLVSLIGYCKASQEMILVYEYMPNGALDEHLHKTKSNGSNSRLSWTQRLNICIGAARGLDYLHTGTSVRQRVLHRDVKSSNILLDDNLAAKISDFGLSRIGPSNLVGTTHVYTSMVRGTFGYMDEEYFLTRRLTRKSDVYAFGVVLFEVLSGRPAVNLILDEEQRGLAGWARRCTKEGTIINQLLDPCLRGKILPVCLEAFVEIANKCILKCPKDRPTMAEVVARLEYAFALQNGMGPPAVEENILPYTTNTYNSSAVSGLPSEGQEVIIASNNSNLHHEKLIDRYGPSASTKKKTIVRKVWSLFSAKATTKLVVDGGRTSESVVFHYDTNGVVDGGRTSETVVSHCNTDGGESIEAFRFELGVIRVATENFSEANKIRQCAISSMYKGRLQSGQGIAVKRYHSYSQRVLREYKNEVSLLVKLEHDNLVQLLGYCMEGTQVLLVYALAMYTSLDRLIFDYFTRALLDWNRRYRIIRGVAWGLRYIHTYAPIEIVHCDVKLANILLDESLNPQLSDFGLARSLDSNEIGWQVDASDIILTRGCIAPEYMQGGLSPKVDVFGFGVLVLEIIRGQRINKDFMHYAWRNWWKGTSSNIIDPTMDVDSSVITRYIQIGLLCVQDDAVERPTMDEVVLMLASDSSLTLPIPENTLNGPSSLTLPIPENPLNGPSSSDSSDNEDLQTLTDDGADQDHDFGVDHDSMEELNLNPR